jgi:hypothetical protein
MARGRNMGTRTATSGRCGHSAGAPGDVSSSADTIAFCYTAPDLASARYWKNPAPSPGPLRDPALQDAIFAACDRMVGVG